MLKNCLLLPLEDIATLMIGGYNYMTAATIFPMLTREFIHLKKILGLL